MPALENTVKKAHNSILIMVLEAVQRRAALLTFLNFNFFFELSFFSHKNAIVMQFYEKRKITLEYAMFININGSCQCLQI